LGPGSTIPGTDCVLDRWSTNASHSAVSSGEIEEIKADQDKLRHVVRTLGVEENKVRKAGAWAAEKIGRARLIIAGDEPGSLGLLLTLEGLIMGVTGKKLMRIALAAAKLPRLNSYDLGRLQRQAEQHVERTEAERISAIR
jgi:hypothetical protein